MKRTRDRSGRARPAPAPNVSFGGQAVSGGANQTASVGQAGAGDGARRPKYNTQARTRDGGMPVTYYAPMERWVGTTARTSVHAPARTSGRRFDPATVADVKAAGIGEGIRQAAMARHSILRTNGAIDVIPRVGPVWVGDKN